MLQLARRARLRAGMIGLAIAVPIASTGLFLLAGTGGASPPLDLQGIDFAELNQQGIVLKAPPEGSQPKLRAEDAPERSGVPLPIKHVVLGRLQTSNVPLYDRLVWIISYDAQSLPVPGGPLNPEESEISPIEARHLPAAYMLAFVDANTGEFLFSVRVNHRR